VAVGDFNGDGKPDFAVVEAGSNMVSVFLGNGDGTFQAPTSVFAGWEPNSTATPAGLAISTAMRWPTCGARIQACVFST